MFYPLTLAAGVVASSIAAAVCALLILSLFPGGKKSKGGTGLSAPLEQAIFLFEDHDLVDATGPARALLSTLPGSGSDWNRLSAYLSQRIDDFEAEIGNLARLGELELSGREGSSIRVRGEWLGQRARLTVIDMEAEGQAVLMDALSLRAQNEELAALRETLGAAPIPVWRENAEGSVVWANDCYLDRAAEHGDIGRDDMTWPVPTIFPVQASATASRRRVLPQTAGRAERWYECHSHSSGAESLNYALPADALVKAETTLREFVQTLSKTFAHLPIGLAIFDRQRQLALFNPALVDLTSLGAEFLSTRPTLFSFLDGLREARVIPEQKDYPSWRAKMAALEQAAASGLYEETWSLPSGQTYKVTGRPHPDGAVAFLVEDISAEITLTRHFRSEIALGQAVVDTLPEAIAVYSSAGDLILSNDAYDRLWGVESGITLGTVTIADSLRLWREMTKPNPVWGELRDFACMIDERAEWDADVTLLTGEILTCRTAPLPGGATLVGFRQQSRRPASGVGPEETPRTVPAEARV